MLNDEHDSSSSAAKERNTVEMTRVKPIKQDISEMSSHVSPSTYHNNKKTQSIELPNRQHSIADSREREFNTTDYVRRRHFFKLTSPRDPDAAGDPEILCKTAQKEILSSNRLQFHAEEDDDQKPPEVSFSKNGLILSGAPVQVANADEEEKADT